MDLWYAPSSPFARKVRIAAHELGFASRLVLREVNPWTDADLRRVNPLAKVPTLVAEDGLVLYESPVICEYLDGLGPAPRLIPPPGPARWDALLLQGLTDGACTSAGRLFAEERRPEALRDDHMIARFQQAIAAALDSVEPRSLATGQWTIGEIGVAVLLGYLDFRWPERDWRSRHPRLAAWQAVTSGRRSMAETRHHLLA